MPTSAPGRAETEPSVAEAPLWSPPERRAAWIGVAIGVALFLLLATGGQPWRLFDEGPYTADFYDVQARSLAHGHLDVPRDVAGAEGFVVDGEVHLYFGLGPALLRAPFTSWTEAFDGRLTLVSELGALTLLGFSAARLLARARPAVPRAPEGRSWWFAVAAAAPAVATPVLFLAAAPVVWHEAELWGAAAGLAGLVLVVRWHDRPTTAHLVQAVAWAAFAMACRPSSGAAPAVALGLFGLVALVRREWRRGLVVVAGAAVALLGFVVVNQARFGSPTSLPFESQIWSEFDPQRLAALEANDGQLVSLKFAPSALRQYLSPVAVEPQRLFPFVTWGPYAEPLGSLTFDNIQHSSSLPTGAPAVLVLAVVGAWWTLRRDRSGVWRVLVVAAAVPTVVTVCYALIAQRYLVDYVPLLLVAAAPAVWVWARQAPGWPRWRRRASAAVLVGLAALGAWGQYSLMLQERTFSIAPQRSHQLALVRVQYDLDERLRGGRPPDVVLVDGDELPEGTGGQVAIVGRCSGLYRNDGRSWSALEWAPGEGKRLVLEGTVGPEGSTVALGDGWDLSLERVDGELVVVYRSEVGQEHRSTALDAGPGAVSVDVAADPLTDQVEASVDGRRVLDLVFVPARGLRAGPGWTSVAGEPTWCEGLLDRMTADG